MGEWNESRRYEINIIKASRKVSRVIYSITGVAEETYGTVA